MTKEEIIGGLQFTVDMFLFNPNTGETYTEPRNDMDKITIDACRGAIEVLKQEPKIGHWEDCSNGWICSNCYRDVSHEYDFCPHCGADMREREVEE